MVCSACAHLIMDGKKHSVLKNGVYIESMTYCNVTHEYPNYPTCDRFLDQFKYAKREDYENEKL